MDAELEAVIGAAEEVGLTRTAVERALRERLNLIAPPTVGDRVFARSADGRAYVADVISVTGDDIRVRFLRGSEHVVPLDQLKPCSLVPGQRVMYEWPWWGPWACTVISYHEPTQYLKLSDRWGSTTTCHISDIWLERLCDVPRGRRRRRSSHRVDHHRVDHAVNRRITRKNARITRIWSRRR